MSLSENEASCTLRLQDSIICRISIAIGSIQRRAQFAPSYCRRHPRARHSTVILQGAEMCGERHISLDFWLEKISRKRCGLLSWRPQKISITAEPLASHAICEESSASSDESNRGSSLTGRHKLRADLRSAGTSSPRPKNSHRCP